MTDEDSSASSGAAGAGARAPGWSALGRRRRANAVGGRTEGHKVRVTPEEEAVLVRLAARQGVSVPRLLVEAAMAQSGETPTQRREAMAELFAIRRLLAGVANNVNQLARHANAGEEFPAEAKHALTAVRRLAFRIDDTLDGMSRP